MSRDLAIDLGTANTLVYAKGKGIILSEPTVVALNTRSREVLSIGDAAWEMIGRTPGYVVAVRPLRQGAITDFDVTERMLASLLKQAGVGKLNRPRVLICVPSVITPVERRAVKVAAKRAGAAEVHLIDEPSAAAIGAGLAMHEPYGSMIVDVGGGTTEAAIFSLGGVVATRAIRSGGFDVDAAIQAHVRAKYDIAIGERSAEAIKLAIGSALPYDDEHDAEIKGRELASGAPRMVVLTPDEIRESIEDHVVSVVNAAAKCLGDAPPEFAQDIMSEGICLLGGGALLRGLHQKIADGTSVAVHVVDLPLETVIKGAGQCLESFDRYKSVFNRLK